MDLNPTDPLRDAPAADAFWQLLPRIDPVAAQLSISRALADVVARANPAVSQLQAVLALDQRATALFDALLVNYIAGDAESPALEKGYWQAAFELTRSFAEAYWYFLRSVRDRQHFRRWREFIPPALLGLFQHRQAELLLRPFVDELSTRFPWKELHEAYQYGEAHALLHQALPVGRYRANADAQSTLEREYVHVLLLDLVNEGHFPPRDAFWTNQRIPRWTGKLALTALPVDAVEPALVVELDNDVGLTRTPPESTKRCLVLDTAPALESIRFELVDLREGSQGPELSMPGRGKQLNLLGRLNVLLSPKLAFIARRGDRKPDARPVELVIGLPQIIRALSTRRPSATATPPRVGSEGRGNSIASLSSLTGVRSTMSAPNSIWGDSIAEVDGGYPLWKIVDRSDSGCRLQGQIFESNWVIPGVLVAFRKDAAAPWMLGVVRRFDKRTGDRADVGVEYMGRNPRGVKITVATASGANSSMAAGNEVPSIAAIYLPESGRQPVMPFKTLVLPVRKYASDAHLTLRSVSALYTIQLKEPIDEQGDFIWTPFEIVARRLRTDIKSAATTSGT
ncbi:MAG: hypothetical protein ABI724_03290 [Betaproteobacteria bacterium]